MNIRKKIDLKYIQNAVFGSMLIFTILFFFWGEMFMGKENPTKTGECMTYNTGWERVYADGKREPISLGSQCDAGWNEVVRVEKQLPDNQDDTWFCMRASQQDMYVYVDGKLRAEYATKATRLFGQNSASAYVFFEIMQEDAGKVLAVETISDSEYSGFLNEMYVGDKFDIAATFLKECSGVLITSILMLIVGICTVVVGFALRVAYKKNVPITYLGLGICQLSMAMISESRVRQFFLPNGSIASHVGFMLTMLVPYPFMVYICRVQKNRYARPYTVLTLMVAMNFIICTFLQFTGLVDYANTTWISYVFIVAMVILMAVTIIIDIFRGMAEEYGVLLVGILVMLAVTLMETYINFVPVVKLHGGILLSIGLIILLFMAAFKTAQDLIAGEREKQIAVAAATSKARFLANMSHEIRTPINTILGMNEMILRENQDETIAEYSRNVQNAGKLLLGLISDVLDFSKIEAGKMDIVASNYHVAPMLSDVINGVSFRAEGKGLYLKTEIDESLPKVLRGDEIRIRQILNNLLSNAVKYTNRGTVTFTVKGVRQEESFCLLASVSDTGIGIRKEDIDKLFGSFERLEEKRNRYIEGTGLGLNITKQLVDLMGGSITVESEYGKGSCFTVLIPQQIMDETPIGGLEDANRMVASEKKETTLFAPDAKVLVVDDNEMNLAVAKALLKRTGVQLELAGGGKAALALCRKTKYDVILMDHMMPDIDGVETLHLLRKDAESLNRDTVVVVLTANAVAGAAKEYLEEGFADYLSKPVVAENLEGMLRKHLPEEKISEVPREERKPEPKQGQAESLREGVASEDRLLIDKELGMVYCDNNESFYKEMVTLYYQQGITYLEQIIDYNEQRDMGNLRIIFHAIKSTSMTIGAKYMQQIAKELEAAAKAGDEEYVFGMCNDFLVDYEAILEKIAAEYGLESR